jgi:hypothetical protein
MGESYVDTIRDKAITRTTKVGRAVDIVKELARKHTNIDTAADDDYIDVRAVNWSTRNPEELVWLSLSDDEREGGIRAGRVRGENAEYRSLEHLIGDATMRLANEETDDVIDVFRIQMIPPNIYGYDDTPVPDDQLDDVLYDLERYRSALEADR